MNPIIIIDITGGTVHTVDSLLAAAVPAGASLVSSLNAQLGSTVWQTHPSGSDLVTALNTQLGSTVWQGGGSGTPAWGAIVGTLADQTDLQTALNGKAASSHTHTLSQISDITVTSEMVSIPKGIRPGLYDDLDEPPVGTIFEGVNDGHLYWCHRDGSVHLLCDSGGYGGGVWGTITGTLSDQTDLQTALNEKQPLDATLTALAGLTTGAGSIILWTGSDTCTTTGFGTTAQALGNCVDTPAARAVLGLTIGTNVQAYDAELQAIAGLASAADTAPYFTGSGTASLMNVTTAARALLDDANAAAMRSTLGLVIGANVQAYDADLAAIAGLTSAADKGIQFTGSGTAATFDLTAAGKALLDDANAAAQRATLGLVIGTDVQAYNGMLANIAAVPQPYDQFIYYDNLGLATRTGISAAARSVLDDSTLDAMITTLGGVAYTGTGGIVRRDNPTLTSGLTLQSGTYFQENYGAPAQSRVRRAQGTVGSPTQTGAGQQIGIFGAQGYTNSSTWGAYTCYIAFVSAEAQTATANGGYLEFFTCPTGSATVVSRGRIGANGWWGIGVSAEPTAPLDIVGDTVRIRTDKTPASASAAGNAGEMCFDGTYLYRCVATNTWKRVALSTW